MHKITEQLINHIEENELAIYHFKNIAHELAKLYLHGEFLMYDAKQALTDDKEIIALAVAEKLIGTFTSIIFEESAESLNVDVYVDHYQAILEETKNKLLVGDNIAEIRNNIVMQLGSIYTKRQAA